MKYLLLILVLITTKLNAQTSLKFDKRYVQSEDRWVAFPQDKDSGYHSFGFIYIDAQAGLTLNYEGTFTISPAGEFIPKKFDSASVKVRLEPNNVLVAFIPENKFQELKIDAVPEWLKYYKTDTNTIERLYKWGYTYNGWGECTKALTYLERAEKIDPKYKGLAVELAYSYNCLMQYDKAEAILEKEIKANPEDAYINKEYIYALTKSNNPDKAINQFETSVKTLKDKQYNAENCYNILHHYYSRNDKKNFQKWYKTFQEQGNENQSMTQNVEAMKAQLSK